MSDATIDEPEGGSVLAYRVRELGRQVRELVNWRRDVDTERALLSQNARTLAEEMSDLKGSVDSLRKVLLGFAFTLAASAVAFALTVLAATGKI